MLLIKQIYEDMLSEYDKIDMTVNVDKIYSLEKQNRGLGGMLFKEKAIEPYINDFSVYEKISELPERFDISNWAFFMAFDDDKPVGAAVAASKTNEVNMLDGRNDMAVLWDIRVTEHYKHRGIGQLLFDAVCAWSRKNGLAELKIECQNINVPACRFYHKQGAVLRKIDEYAYHDDERCKDEVQLIWYLDLKR